MNLSVGIVGLPNVGKSTLFNALLKKQLALAANYPFATIEPNVGVVAVPDERLEMLAKITAEEITGHEPHPDPLLKGEGNLKLPPIRPATVEFVDIAGLVKGAAEGAGLGNKFLSHIREVSVICHVVRAFTDENIIREGSSDPQNDYAVIETELLLADLQTARNVQSRIKRNDDPLLKTTVDTLIDNLDAGIPAREIVFSEEELAHIEPLFLLTLKPELIALNVSEEVYTVEKIPQIISTYQNLLSPDSRSLDFDRDDKMVVICAKIESDLSSLSEDEQKGYLEELGFKTSGLERLIQKAYERLGLISFLTCGVKEVKAWTIQKGETAPQAAGAIHTDFTKKFIKAEVVSYVDFVQFGGWKGSREHGKARLEGKDYVMQDGDVVEFKIGA